MTTIKQTYTNPLMFDRYQVGSNTLAGDFAKGTVGTHKIVAKRWIKEGRKFELTLEPVAK